MLSSSLDRSIYRLYLATVSVDLKDSIIIYDLKVLVVTDNIIGKTTILFIIKFHTELYNITHNFYIITFIIKII